MIALLALLALASIFYLVLPGIGGFYVRNRWRAFRARLVAASTFPTIRYERIVDQQDGYLGHYRFLGGLEAIQGDNTIWIRNGGLSLSAELEGVSVYVLPSLSFAEAEGTVERNDEALPDEMPSQVPWNRIFSLPEGTQMLVSGSLYSERGRGVFRADGQQPLTVVIYDGDARTLMRRAIWGGRQRNEYWNQFTPISLVLGSFVLLILGYNFLHAPMMRLQAVTALVLSLTPIVPLLPPGLLLFFLYRHFWRRGRLNRAERDLLRLPLRYLPDGALIDGLQVRLPDGELYGVRVYADQQTAVESVKPGKIRTASVIGRGELPILRYYGFGRVGEERTNGRLKPPSDPLAELLLIPGDPGELSAVCTKRAKRYELAALLVLACGYLMNALVVFWLLGTLIR